MSIFKPPATSDAVLAARIGWICQTLRFASAGYLFWLFYQITRLWIEEGRAARAYSVWLKVDLSTMNGFQRLAGFSLSFALWCIVAAAIFSVWRLCSNFLAGRILTADTAALLKRISFLGITAQIADLFARPAISSIVTFHLPEAQRQISYSINPNDLLVMLFLTSLYALAHIFQVAAEMAEEQAQII
jgi:hypothetical protein